VKSVVKKSSSFRVRSRASRFNFFLMQVEIDFLTTDGSAADMDELDFEEF